jgi:parvulin-like peptidyl-prolyl isomerase
MDAANPLCRFVMLGVGLIAVLGCQTDDSGVRARGQIPQDPLAPIAPPPMPPVSQPAPYPLLGSAAPIAPAGPMAPLAPAAPGGAAAPIAPLAPLAPVAPPAPGGVLPAVAGVVPGSRVDASMKGPAVVPASYAGGPNAVTARDDVNKSVPRVKVAAIVGANNVITVQEVIESVWQQYDALSKLEGREREAKQKELYTAALRRTIERELILDEMYGKLKKANKSGVIDEIKTLAAQMTDKQLRDMKKKIGAKTDDELKMWLEAQGLTLPVLRRQFERQIMAQQYINSMMKETGRRVGMAEVRDYYEKHPDEFRLPDRVKWQHIFVSFGAPPNPQAAQARMEAIRQRVAAGEDFAGLSMQFDEGFAKRQRGFGTGERRSGSGENKEDWIQPLDVEPTVWALKAGEVSPVIQTPTGYHLVKVVQREYAGVRPFDPKLQSEIRDKMNKELSDLNEAKMVEELWRKGVVRVVEE